MQRYGARGAEEKLAGCRDCCGRRRNSICGGAHQGRTAGGGAVRGLLLPHDVTRAGCGPEMLPACLDSGPNPPSQPGSSGAVSGRSPPGLVYQAPYAAKQYSLSYGFFYGYAYSVVRLSIAHSLRAARSPTPPPTPPPYAAKQHSLARRLVPDGWTSRRSPIDFHVCGATVEDAIRLLSVYMERLGDRAGPTGWEAPFHCICNACAHLGVP